MSPLASSKSTAPASVAARWRPRRLYDSPYHLLVLAMLFWSGNFIVGRAVHATVPPIGLAFWRWTGGLLLVLPFAWRHLRRDLPVLRAHWPLVLLLSAAGIATFNTLVYTGLRSTTALNGLLMQSTMPVFILLCSFLLFGDRPGRAQVGGIVLSLAGVAVIVSRGEPLALLRVPLNMGDVWVFAAVVSYALYSALLRRRPAVHPSSFLATTFALGAAMLLPFHLGEHLSGRALRLEAPTLLAIGYVAVFPSVLAYFCYNRGVELIGANRAGQFLHLMPVFGSLMALLFLGEAFRSFHAGGAALIIAGIVLAARAAPKPTAASEPPSAMTS